MGVTIHFEGRLSAAGEYSIFLTRVRDFASKHQWAIEDIPPASRSLKRVRDEQDWDYVGVTKGLVVYPHKNAEPLRFEFDGTLYIQEYCKTQFAGPATHILIVELLRELKPLFETLSVDDEGEYWDSNDVSLLNEHVQHVNLKIAELVAERPSGKTAVRLPSGRIVDIIG